MPSTQHPTLETLLGETERSSADLSTLLSVGALLNSTLDLGEVLRVSMEQAARAMDAEGGSILLIETTTGDLIFDVATGTEGERTKEVRLRRGEGIAGWVATHGKPVRVDDAQADPRFTSRVDRRTTLTTRSILCVPLKVKERMIGVIEVINKRGGKPFSGHDEEILVILSHQIATAIDNAQLYRRVYEEKETLRAVLDSMADGVIVVDRDDRILLHNRAILGLLGVDVDGLSVERFGDDRLRGLAGRLASENKRSVSFNLEVGEGPSPCTLANTAAALRDPAGEVSGAVLVMRDVTERARLEKMKNDFIATTSHKLRTPLTSILTFASLLKNEKLRNSGDGEDFIGEAASAIEEQGRYLRELIEKLLGFSGMEMDNVQIEKEPVDAAVLLQEAAEELRARADAKSIHLEHRAEPGTGEVRIDRRKILHVLANLAENAVKFSPPETTVTLSAHACEDDIQFRVSDEGPGIAPEERDRIFEKFYQIDRDLTGQVEGVGLGLALCKNIVTAHGGRIVLESSPGRGSTFSVSLPRG